MNKILKIKVFFYWLLWYRFIYHDKKWNILPIRNCPTYIKKCIHKEKVINTFSHLQYIFKIDLYSNKVSSVKINMKHFTETTINRNINKK